MKKIITWMPVIAIIALVTYSSSQAYVDQDLRPFLNEHFSLDWVRTYFGSVQFFYAGREISVDFLGPAAFIEFFIRKGAHFLVFFLLGFSFYSAISRKKGASYKKIFYSFLFVVVCAIFDEIHQYFNGGRTALVEDVILDSVGGLTGIFFAYISNKRKKGRKRK